MLDRARAHRNRISGLELSEPASRSSRSSQVGKDDWLAIVGIDTETRIALKVERNNKGEVQFLLRSDERRNSARDTGDEIVPLAGAIPLFLDESRLVCVTLRDFGYWELRDRVLSIARSFHGLLRTMNMLHRLIIRFFLKKEDTYGNTWGRRLPGVAEWNPPLDLEER